MSTTRAPYKCFLLAATVVPSLADAQQAPALGQTWIQKLIINRLTFSGQRTLGYQKYSVKGDGEAFNSLTNFGTGLQTFTDIGNLSVTGNSVLGFLNFRANFTDNRFSDPEQQQYTLTYKKQGWDVSYGTVQASLLSSNRFVNFSRSLEGLVAGFNAGRFSSKVITSDTRGAARTINIEGNNTAGPYYLQSGRIIPDSLEVQLDGAKLIRSKDFITDTQLGTITFINRVIPPTSTLVATYESYDFGGQRGKIKGVGMNYDFGKFGRIGFNRVEQLTGNSNSNPERIEKSFGFGRPGDQYFLLFEPIPGTVRITVDGIPRSFSVNNDGVSDFFLDARLPILIISRVAIPITQEIIFTYQPKVVQTVSGDRLVTGFDYRLPISKGSDSSGGTYLQYSQSSGQLKGLSPSSGLAQGLDFRISEGKGDFKANFRKIQPGYQSIEQTGFNRNEDAVDYSLAYNTKNVTTNLQTINTVVSFTDFSGAAPVIRSSRITTSQASVGHAHPPSKTSGVTRSNNLSWNRTRADNTSTTNLLDTLTYKEDYRNKKLGLGFATERQTGEGFIEGKQQGVSVNTYRANVNYDPGKNWAISANASRSGIRLGTTQSEGFDYSLRASMAETGPWAGGIDYTVSDSGALASLGGFLNGGAFGYTNNGFSGSGGSGTLSTGQLKVRRFTMSANHRAGEAISLGLNLIKQSSSGLSTSNAEIDTLSLTSSWRLNDSDNLNLDWSRSTSVFFSATAQRANSDTLSANFSGGKKNWSYNIGYNLFSSGGDTFNQRSLGLNGDIGFRINSRSRLFANLSGAQTRGFFPQDDVSFNAGYAYNLGAGLILQGRYAFRDLKNLDPLATGGAFQSNGLSLELTFDFSSRR